MRTSLSALIILSISFYLGFSINKANIFAENSSMNESYEAFHTLGTELDETSGLAYSVKHPDLIYQVNDSGNEAILYRTDESGRIESKLQLNIGVHDFESITVGQCGDTSCIYIFDTGDNLFIRKNYSVYQITENDFDQAKLNNLKQYRFSFPNGASYDIEATAFSDDGIYIFTKGSSSEVFRLNIGSNIKLEKLGSLDIYKASGADFKDGYFYICNLDFIHKISKESLMSGQTLEVLSKPRTWQSEGLAIKGDHFLISSESHGKDIPAKLIRFSKYSTIDNYKKASPPKW